MTEHKGLEGGSGTAPAKERDDSAGAAVRMRGLTGPSSTAQRKAVYVVTILLAMVAVPAGITLHTVRTPATFYVTSDNPTPYGYTVSLVLFVIPIAVIALW